MDDDAEFRDIIIKNLEEKGVLQSIRAKLRAHIYNLVDSDPAASHAESANNQTATLGLGEDESIALSLVQDLLECLNLSYTSSVLRAELRQTYAHWPRRRIADVLQLDLDETTATDADSSRNVTTNEPNLSVDAKSQAADFSGEESKGGIEDGSVANDSHLTAVAAAGQSSQTPLLVEILRRLPKTTDESTTTKTEDEDEEEEEVEEATDASSRSVAEEDINSETFVALSRSANLTSESL